MSSLSCFQLGGGGGGENHFNFRYANFIALPFPNLSQFQHRYRHTVENKRNSQTSNQGCPTTFQARSRVSHEISFQARFFCLMSSILASFAKLHLLQLTAILINYFRVWFQMFNSILESEEPYTDNKNRCKFKFQ